MELAIRENKRFLEEEPLRRKAINFLCFKFSDIEFPSEFHEFKPEIAASNLTNLGPDVHKLIMEKLQIVPFKM